MATINDNLNKHLDIIGADNVEIQIREDGKVIWINTDFGCKLRIGRIENLQIIDRRTNLSQ